ncbi:tRNA guanosine(34) transglycosylase Tgt [Patescibacteria group bacterium]|nr:tRNA guanosine(34) transglycosylase Tgt [Patescibacteria group bacterium]
MSWRIIKSSKKSSARAGTLSTRHGRFATPAFMPVATRGAVKSLSAEELHQVGSQIILANTYHLWQRPGLSIIKKAGGLHNFMNWDGPILTDSGGYQVYSLAKLRKITEQGVSFVSEIDGTKLMLTPEKAIDIQQVLGSDIMMVLDECPPYPSTVKYARNSMALTTRWAKRSLNYKKKKRISQQLLFGIVQGSVYKSLRQAHAAELSQLNFDGYALGGLAVGEPTNIMYRVLDFTVPILPFDKPRYLMGTGKPDQIVEAVKRGIDMFDCVIPTRHARHGTIYIWKSNKPQGNFFDELRIKQSKFAKDLKPLDKRCGCQTCTNYSRAYLRHLFMSGDPLGSRLASLHNVYFYLELMAKLRVLIKSGKI